VAAALVQVVILDLAVLAQLTPVAEAEAVVPMAAAVQVQGGQELFMLFTHLPTNLLQPQAHTPKPLLVVTTSTHSLVLEL
jgi:hypothetical protein